MNSVGLLMILKVDFRIAGYGESTSTAQSIWHYDYQVRYPGKSRTLGRRAERDGRHCFGREVT